MALKIIVSYDDTDNDRDALALGRLLAFSGAELSLAYVRHSYGEALEEKQAEELLARGAASVGAPDMPQHVVVNPSTSDGLTELAERENADVIVFGSEYRTAPGLVKPGISAHKLLLGGPAAIAVAPAGLRSQPVGQRQHDRRHRRGRPGRAGRPRRASPRRSAPRWPSTAAGRVDLLVVGSRPEAPAGQGRPQRRQRLRGRGGDLPGAGRPARRRDQLRRGQSPAGFRLTRITAATSGSRPSIRSPRALPARPAAARRSPASVRDGLLGASSASTTIAAGRLRRRRALARPGLAAVTSSERALGVRPALAEGEVRRLQLRPLEDPQLALAAGPTRGRRARSCRSVEPGLDDLRSAAPPRSRLKARACCIRGADLDVERHPTTLCSGACEPPLPDAVVFDNDGLLLDTESVWTRAEQDLFERRGLEFTPADKRELVGTSAEIAGGGPRAPARRAGAGGGADRGAERAGRRRARARGGGDGRRPRAAARAARARHADRPGLQLAARLRPPLARDRAASRTASTSSSAPTKSRRRSRRPTPTSRPAGGSASSPAPRSSPSRTRRPGSPRPAPPA